MREVTKEQFYATVGQMNVHPTPERDVTFWYLNNSRRLVGKCSQGYVHRFDEEPRYYVVDDL